MTAFSRPHAKTKHASSNLIMAYDATGQTSKVYRCKERLCLPLSTRDTPAISSQPHPEGNLVKHMYDTHRARKSLDWKPSPSPRFENCSQGEVNFLIRSSHSRARRP